MPFESQDQNDACFATNGFGGKVDCKEWADKTNYNALPQKKKPTKGTKKADDLVGNDDDDTQNGLSVSPSLLPPSGIPALSQSYSKSLPLDEAMLDDAFKTAAELLEKLAGPAGDRIREQKALQHEQAMERNKRRQEENRARTPDPARAAINSKYDENGNVIGVQTPQLSGGTPEQLARAGLAQPYVRRYMGGKWVDVPRGMDPNEYVQQPEVAKALDKVPTTVQLREQNKAYNASQGPKPGEDVVMRPGGNKPSGLKPLAATSPGAISQAFAEANVANAFGKNPKPIDPNGPLPSYATNPLVAATIGQHDARRPISQQTMPLLPNAPKVGPNADESQLLPVNSTDAGPRPLPPASSTRVPKMDNNDLADAAMRSLPMMVRPSRSMSAAPKPTELLGVGSPPPAPKQLPDVPALGVSGPPKPPAPTTDPRGMGTFEEATAKNTPSLQGDTHPTSRAAVMTNPQAQRQVVADQEINKNLAQIPPPASPNVPNPVGERPLATGPRPGEMQPLPPNALEPQPFAGNGLPPAVGPNGRSVNLDVPRRVGGGGLPTPTVQESMRAQNRENAISGNGLATDQDPNPRYFGPPRPSKLDPEVEEMYAVGDGRASAGPGYQTATYRTSPPVAEPAPVAQAPPPPPAQAAPESSMAPESQVGPMQWQNMNNAIGGRGLAARTINGVPQPDPEPAVDYPEDQIRNAITDGLASAGPTPAWQLPQVPPGFNNEFRRPPAIAQSAVNPAQAATQQTSQDSQALQQTQQATANPFTPEVAPAQKQMPAGFPPEQPRQPLPTPVGGPLGQGNVQPRMGLNIRKQVPGLGKIGAAGPSGGGFAAPSKGSGIPSAPSAGAKAPTAKATSMPTAPKPAVGASSLGVGSSMVMKPAQQPVVPIPSVPNFGAGAPTMKTANQNYTLAQMLIRAALASTRANRSVGPELAGAGMGTAAGLGIAGGAALAGAPVLGALAGYAGAPQGYGGQYAARGAMRGLGTTAGAGVGALAGLGAGLHTDPRTAAIYTALGAGAGGIGGNLLTKYMLGKGPAERKRKQ